MLSNNKLEFLNELKSDNFYPFTKDIEDDIYEFILELKNRQIVQIENYQVSIVNHQAIDEIINSKSLDHSTDLKNKENQTKYPARIMRMLPKLTSIERLIIALGSIITIIVGIIAMMSNKR